MHLTSFFSEIVDILLKVSHHLSKIDDLLAAIVA
ncbi:Uncharacterised protein [Streptococcus macacae NCTC 11558]|nr:Uncharacterised protein [Streptococcus macacae NCTC 11558]